MSQELLAPPPASAVNPALMYLANLRAEKSRENMRYVLERVARDIFQVEGIASAPWTTLRPHHLVLMKAILQRDGLSMSTVQVFMSAMRGVVKAAFENDQVDAGVQMKVQMVKSPAPTDQKPGRAFELPEIRGLLEALDSETNPTRRARDKAVFALMLWAGFRCVDTKRLQMADIREGGKKLVATRKGGKVQEIALNPRVTEALLEWLAFRGDAPGPVICWVRKGNVIHQDKDLSKKSYWDIFKKYLNLACIGPATPHDARSTFAWRLHELGAPLAIIQELMGHADPKTTIRYLRRLDKAAANTIREIDLMQEAG